MSADRVTDGQRLREQVRSLPDEAGVYLFRGAQGEVLYVGKAKALRNRIGAYFGAQAKKSPKLQGLVRRIRDVETFILSSEAEALLLEWNLIREHRPRFNIQLRDDKSYPYIKVTLSEPFPRIYVTRRLREDGSRYFGPFTNVGTMRRTLRVIKRMYTVRSCHFRMPDELPSRPCLDYHIGRCKAPCAGYQSQADYRAMIGEILEILSGHTSAVRREVERRMRKKAEELDFERAGELRDVLQGLQALQRRQAAVDFRGGDRDVLGIARQDRVACGVVLKVREGRLLGRQVHYLRNIEGEDDAQIVGAFIKGVYLRRSDLPPELVAPVDFADRTLVEEYLSAQRDGIFSVRIPVRGHKRRLVELAETNARHVLAQDSLLESPGEPDPGEGAVEKKEVTPVPAAAQRLGAVLDFPVAPRNLICFDISTLGGSESVGSAVWLEDGQPCKSEYRHFRIQATDYGHPDDYAMMQEVVGRYFGRRVREGLRLPDLVVIDGGRGQLSAAQQAMEATGVSDLPVVALAKREEEIYRPGFSRPLRLSAGDPGLRWLQRIRNESHRFALRYNRTLRRRRTLRSRLSRISGVGPAREQELLRHFGSLKAVREASLEELYVIPGIGPTTALRIRDALGRARTRDADRRSGERTEISGSSP